VYKSDYIDFLSLNYISLASMNPYFDFSKCRLTVIDIYCLTRY